MKKQLFIKQKGPFSRCPRFSWICLPVFLTLLVFCSCNKEDSIINNDNIIKDDITFRDGRLIFKDNASFMDHQKWLYENQSNPQLIVDKNKSLGLKSMTEYYLEGMKLEESDPKFSEYVAKYPSIFIKETYDNSTLYLLPHSIILCYVANKDGIYQVGDKIYRIAGDYIYQLNDGDESKIKMLLLSKDQISNEDIKVAPSYLDAKSDWAQRTRYFSNHKFRIVSSLRIRYDPYYYIDYYELLTNPQHRVLGIWGRAQLATKGANGWGYFQFAGTSISFTINPNHVECTGLSTLCLFANLYWPLYDIDWIVSYLPAYSRGRLDTQYIYIYWPDAFDEYPAVQFPDWIPDVTEPF